MSKGDCDGGWSKFDAIGRAFLMIVLDVVIIYRLMINWREDEVR